MNNAYKFGACAYLGFAVFAQGCSSDDASTPAGGGAGGHAGATNHGGASQAGAAGAHTAGANSAGANEAGTDNGGADDQGGTPGAGAGGADTGGSAGTGGRGGAAGAGGATAGAGGATAGAGGNPNAGLILDYKFDEGPTPNIVDSTANNNTAHVPGFQWLAGKVGNALHLSDSRYVALPAGLTTGVTDFTVGVWVRPTQVDNWSRIFDFGIDQNQFVALIAQSGDLHVPVLELKTSTVDLKLQANVNTTLTPGVWQYVAVTQAGSTATMYINGVSVGTADFGTARIKDIVTTANTLGKSKFNDPTFQGDLDEFRMYKRALSTADVALLATPAAVTGAGPALQYSFEDTALTVTDTGGSSQNGQISPADVSWIAGKVGAHAVSLGLGSGYLVMPNDILKNVTDFTFAAWVNETTAHDWAQIVDVGTGQSSYFALIANAQDTQTMRVSIKNGTEEKLDGPALVPGAWTHVVVTRKGTTVHLYVNGVSVAQGLFANVLPNNGATATNWLGKDAFGDANFEGSLDDVRFYSRALSSDEVTALASGN